MNAPEKPPAHDFIESLAPELQPARPAGPCHGQQHRLRREALAQWISGQGGGVAVIAAGEEVIRNRDNPYAFRSHSDFLYMTGFPEPGAWWVMRVEANGKTKSMLACRPRDPEREVWDGVRVGPLRAASDYEFDEAIDVRTLNDAVIELAGNMPAFYAHVGVDAEMDERLRRWLNALRAMGRAGVTAPDRIIDISQVIARQRLIKDAHELATMQASADISSRAHVRAMKACKAGLREYELEAEILHTFRAGGAQSPAYGSIVASGPHSCILHHRASDRILRNGELVLIDAGCELDGYAADITRTFPVSGKFTAQQKAVYEVVLSAQEAAISATRPGADMTGPHTAAVRVLAQGMIDLGLIKGKSLDDAIADGDYKRFYMHRTGHWLGLDVHDVGDYTMTFVPGMVTTIEPGFYIRPSADIDAAFWNIGIRIEDDAVVTDDGCRLLTRGVPVSVAEIEKLMHD